MYRRGAVFVFEGPDGVGKTSLVSAVEERLKNGPQPVLSVSFPGRISGTLGAHIYDLHHQPLKHNIHTLTPDALQVLHVAAHVETIKSTIRPHVEGGGIVLLDRFWWSTSVYGRLAGMPLGPLNKLVELEQAYWKGIAPRIVFLLSRPAALIDAQQRAAFARISRQYDCLAEKELRTCRVVRIENSDRIELIARAIEQVITGTLHGAAGNNEGSPIRVRKRLTPATPNLPFDTVAAPSLPSTCVNTFSAWSRLAPAHPTVVFDTYWRFATERQAIFFRRFRGRARPWTQDAILDKYKFTNAYRASDRVSQYLIRHVIYDGDQSPREVFFRTILFKFFNRVETWKRLTASLGELTARQFKPHQYDKVLTSILESGKLLYSGAYIMPTGGSEWKADRKHRMHLRLLEYILSRDLPERILGARNLREAFETLKSIPTIGDFLAYQYAIDLNYSTATGFDENEFVVPGPGARDGIRKCFESLGGLTESDLIRFVCDHQEDEFSARQLPFEDLWGRRLKLVDCQNLFCEVDKYARVYHPKVKGKSGRTRIKQQFRPSGERLDYWYPPKWELNNRIASLTSSEARLFSPEDGRDGIARYQ